MYFWAVEAKDNNISNGSGGFLYKQTNFCAELSVWSCWEESKNHWI